MLNKKKLVAYEVYNAIIDGHTEWSGKVIGFEDEAVGELIAKKYGGKRVGVDSTTRITNIDIDSLYLKNITVSELIKIMRYVND